MSKKSDLYLRLCVGHPEKITSAHGISFRLSLCLMNDRGNMDWLGYEYGGARGGFSTNDFYSGLSSEECLYAGKSALHLERFTYKDYRDEVRLMTAESMVKTMRSVDKKIEKLSVYEEPRDLGSQVEKIGKALKLKGIFIDDRFGGKAVPLNDSTFDVLRRIESGARLECDLLDRCPIGAVVRVRTSCFFTDSDLLGVRTLEETKGEPRLVEMPIEIFKDQLARWRKHDYFADVVNVVEEQS